MQYILTEEEYTMLKQTSELVEAVRKSNIMVTNENKELQETVYYLNREVQRYRKIINEMRRGIEGTVAEFDKVRKQSQDELLYRLQQECNDRDR